MIINDKEAATRLASPMNLINQLRNNNGNNKRKNAMSLFIPSSATQKQETPKSFNPFSPIEIAPPVIVEAIKKDEIAQPLLNDILENHDAQIKLGLAHDNALSLLNRSVDMLSAKLDDIRADKLPSVVGAASKVVESIRRERSEREKNDKDREVHYHFYTPQQRKVSDYEVIDVA